MLKEENWTELRRLGTVVHLRVQVEVLIDRLAKSRRIRPLLEFPDWHDRFRSLYSARAPLYAKADLAVDADELTHDEVVDAIVKELG